MLSQEKAVPLHTLYKTCKAIGDPLAQLVSPKRITKRKAKRRQQKDKSYKINILWDFFYCLLTTLTATKRSLTDKK